MAFMSQTKTRLPSWQALMAGPKKERDERECITKKPKGKRIN